MVTETLENYPVKCLSCGWTGKTSELVKRYMPNPLSLGDVIPTPVCPICGNESLEEDKDV